ncbi:hypothetical protein EVAR_64390_1 [Eumeta japonica]|uniref:Uncharacterized protein n=1 Tax=Eumeta variegata TaxID=151549 RepID=A0A4C1SDS7_EUMVA|nr:hypothetical protein EVAR_64390_1 [Eumeta japonica]
MFGWLETLVVYVPREQSSRDERTCFDKTTPPRQSATVKSTALASNPTCGGEKSPPPPNSQWHSLREGGNRSPFPILATATVMIERQSKSTQYALLSTSV